jgi:Xaa-Pro dipeptidase
MTRCEGAKVDTADERERFARLVAAEERGMALLDAIETAQLIAPGRSERAIERDIVRLAADRFAVEKHWHKRIVRSGPNTLATAVENPPDRLLDEDDIVFLDLGPVIGEWEADVGRTYALGADPLKQALCRELPKQFDAIRSRFLEAPDITGAELYEFACTSADRAGWRFGGVIAGHVVAEFPHAHLPGERLHNHIRPENGTRLRDRDGHGRLRYWIIEVHLVAPDGAFGGFYERLLRP